MSPAGTGRSVNVKKKVNHGVSIDEWSQERFRPLLHPHQNINKVILTDPLGNKWTSELWYEDIESFVREDSEQYYTWYFHENMYLITAEPDVEHDNEELVEFICDSLEGKPVDPVYTLNPPIRLQFQPQTKFHFGSSDDDPPDNDNISSFFD
jgi:hypothetical protein